MCVFEIIHETKQIFFDAIPPIEWGRFNTKKRIVSIDITST
jgi:hypothetical protein